MQHHSLRQYLIQNTVLLALFVLAIVAVNVPAKAHFLLDASARLVHVAEDSDNGELLVYFRIPGPLAYADALAQRKNPTDIVDAPYLSLSMVQGQPFYALDREAIARDREGFAAFLTRGYKVEIDGKKLEPGAVRAAYFSEQDHPDFDTIAKADASFATFDSEQAKTDGAPIYVADALFDLKMRFPAGALKSSVSIQNALPEILLPEGVTIENLVLDHRSEPARVIQIRGQLIDPVLLDGSWLGSLANFIWQGIWHILIGLDHVLFVVCLALAAGLSVSILWSVTGFTLGHSVTLYLGSIGLAPQGAWFIPAVETVIALSIIYAAFLVILRQRTPKKIGVAGGFGLFFVAGMIGLIHGYGFSFVLGDLLGGDTGQLVLALIGFNIGVEVGQLGIVLVVFALLWLAARIHQNMPMGVAYASSLFAIGMALIWCWERTQDLMTHFT